MAEPVFEVSDFVAVFNQTISYAYPVVTITGELSQFRVSKNRWTYFDLKDEAASVRFFGTVYNLPGPLEDGMLLIVRGVPQLHPQFGFSITVQSIQLAGEGTIKKAQALLEAKLTKEGLFDPSRKRVLPHPPISIGLVTSGESAAYADFTKILGYRWGGIEVYLYDVQVQGQSAPEQIIRAVDYFNSHSEPPEVLVITRGGGSADDLQAFNTEQVTKAIAASRIPTLVAIGHEVDVSLAERAADKRASTPSNAAEILVPDKHEVRLVLKNQSQSAKQSLKTLVKERRQFLAQQRQLTTTFIKNIVASYQKEIASNKTMLQILDPKSALKRGYAVVRSSGRIVRSAEQVKIGQKLHIELNNGIIGSQVTDIEIQ